MLARTYRSYKTLNYKLVNQRAKNTYAIAAELNRTYNSNVIHKSRLFSFLHKYNLNTHMIRSYVHNLIPSILYERKAPKGM